jgi:transformation/transcription domain-associated protein
VIRIDRFEPEIEIVRAHGGYQKRIAIRGHDGSMHYFIIQHPALRTARREERVMQIFQVFNGYVNLVFPILQLVRIMGRRVETLKRGLQFNIPTIVPLAPQVRLIHDDTANITLYEVYERYCKKRGQYKDEPLIYFIQQMKKAFAVEDMSKKGVC